MRDRLLARIEEFPRFPYPAGKPPQAGEVVGMDLDQTDKTATTAEDAMSEPQLRWRQRLESLQRALGQLEAALQAHDADPESEVIGMAVIKAYEFSFELSWETLKDLLSHQGLNAILPREVLHLISKCQGRESQGIQPPFRT